MQGKAASCTDQKTGKKRVINRVTSSSKQQKDQKGYFKCLKEMFAETCWVHLGPAHTNEAKPCHQIILFPALGPHSRA